MSNKEYSENRAKMPVAELIKYEGNSVAFSADGMRIIASSPDLAALDALVIATGACPEHVALERIDFQDSCLGGAEIL
jgi:hypothetical protein